MLEKMTVCINLRWKNPCLVRKKTFPSSLIFTVEYFEVMNAISEVLKPLISASKELPTVRNTISTYMHRLKSIASMSVSTRVHELKKSLEWSLWAPLGMLLCTEEKFAMLGGPNLIWKIATKFADSTYLAAKIHSRNAHKLELQWKKHFSGLGKYKKDMK